MTKVFGRRSRRISGDRIAKVLNTDQTDRVWFQRLVPRQRKAQWAPCTLYWAPNGQERGVCVDLSDTGARVRFRSRTPLPQQLRLVSAQLGLNRACVLVRRDENDAAVRFSD